VYVFFSKLFVSYFSGSIRIRRHGQEQYHMQHGFLFKAALSSVPPVLFLSSGHCGQWVIQVFDVWQTNLRCFRKTFSEVHGKGTPILGLRNFVKFCSKCASPFSLDNWI